MDLITEVQVRATEKLLLYAVKRSDVAILTELLHDDLLFVAPNGSVITKAMDLDSHRAGAMAVNSMEISDQRISIIGDNAIVTMQMETKGKMMGEHIQGKFQFVRI
jgi:ketosteroid isomerase-like protein